MKTLTLFLVMLVAALGWLAPNAQAQPCAPPTGVSVSNVTTTGAVVNFIPSASAVSYTVRYFWTGDSTTIYTVSATSSPVTLTGLVAGRFYLASVMSNCAGGYTTSSPWVRFQTAGGTTPVGCAAPTNLRIASLTTTSASIAFTGTSSSYRVVYYAWGDSVNAVTLTVSGSPVAISGLLPNTSYVVRIFSNCNGATSTPAGFTFRTPALPVTCGAVTNVVVTATSASTASVSFASGANNTRYTVTCSAPGDSVRQATGTASPITIGGLVPGRTYTVQVQSICGTGSSVTYTAGAPVNYSFRGTLTARSGFSSGAVELYPNPAHRNASLVLPAVPGAAQARLLLLNGLGQPVRTLTVPLVGAETLTALDLAGVAPGLYTLRIAAGSQVVSQRLAVE